MIDPKTDEMEKVPEGWTQATLGNRALFELIMGQSPSSETYTTKKIGLPFLQGNADFGVIHPHPKTYCTEPLKVAEKDDVLISVRAPVGEVNIATERYCIGRGLGAIRPNNKHDSKFLYYYFNHYRHDLERISAGSTFKAITKDDLEKFSVALPPSEEKQKIISILTTVDDAIQRSRQVAAETERLKAGVMHELMTKGIGHTEFREDPDVGRIPDGWEVKQLGEVCSVKTGPFGAQLHMSDYVAKGTPIITVEHLGDLGIIHENLPLVSDSDKNRLKEYHLKEGDIVFSRVGSVDRSCYISKKESGWLFSCRLLRVRSTADELLPEFLNHYFRFEGFKHRIRSASVGGTMANLNTTIMSQIKIIFPTVPEQQQITSILSTIDRKLTLQHQRTAHYEKLKQGLMNDLLTGERREKVA